MMIVVVGWAPVPRRIILWVVTVRGQMKPYEIAIVGGGIVGLATAHALTRDGNRRVVVLEAETEVARHQTGNNSGVIHSGLYYRPGSLKASNCTRGRDAIYRFCDIHEIPHERCGKLVVALSEEERPRLDELERRGQANGLEGLRRVTGDQLLEYEPNVAGIDGLWVPTTGIIDYIAAAKAIRILSNKELSQRMSRRKL